MYIVVRCINPIKKYITKHTIDILCMFMYFSDVKCFPVYCRFNKIAIPNSKFQMAKWTRTPLAYRESKNVLIYM